MTDQSKRPTTHSDAGQALAQPQGSAKRNTRIWGISLEFDEIRRGDITKLTYTSSNDVVTYEYRPPWTCGKCTERDYGLARFMAYRRIIGRKPKLKTSWRQQFLRTQAQAQCDRPTMNPDTKAKLREEFVYEAYPAANKTHDSFLLFDAGDLGFCLLEWSGQYWRARWFDEARQLSPSSRERLGEKVPRITRPARFADQDGGKSRRREGETIMSTAPKRRYKYMHTINGLPGHYYPGAQICYSDGTKPIPMCDTLDQIKREQRASVAWRKRQGYPISDKYGWFKVAI